MSILDDKGFDFDSVVLILANNIMKTITIWPSDLSIEEEVNIRQYHSRHIAEQYTEIIGFERLCEIIRTSKKEQQIMEIIQNEIEQRRYQEIDDRRIIEDNKISSIKGSQKTILDYAIEYYHTGWSIFPLISKSKKPLVDSWEPYQKERADEEQIRQWFSNTNNNNIAIVTGRISGIFAFDNDGEKAKNYFDEVFEKIDEEGIKAAINSTVHIKTGGGNTNIILGFRKEEFLEGEEIENSILWTDRDGHTEIRLKGERGYIVAPPSIHPNGNQYEISGTYPAVLSKEQILRLIAAFKCVQNKKVPTKNYTAVQVRQQELLDEETIDDIVAILKPYYRLGIRNDFVLYLSGWLRKEHITIDAARKVIKAIAEDDEEKQSRLRTLEETYAKDNLSDIKGYSGLLTLLVDQMEEDEERAYQILKRIEEILPAKHREEQQEKRYEREEENILKLVWENSSEFFLDQFGLPYAAITVNGHFETMSLTSKRFKNWVCKLFYERTGDLLKAEDLASISNILKAEAEFGGNIKQLYLRVGNNNQVDLDTNYYYYDLTNGSWEVVKITGTEWKIEKSPPIIFRRYNNQQPQVYPVRGYPHDIFDQFMNLINIKDEDNKLLLKCYIIALFIPEIPKPVLMLHGEQGSAKSTLQELIKMVVDPSIIRTLSFPGEINELIQKLAHNYVAYFDNISVIKELISDELCRAVTGSGFSKRQLYTDDDDIIYNFKRCIGFNGINLGATKADLLDRALIIQLERIPKEKRCKVEEIWKEFEKIKAQVLGYIFDILVRVIKKRNDGGIELKGHPRMADFAEVSEIISRCMGYNENKFLAAYYKNIGLQTQQALEASPLATAIMEFLNSRIKWEGTCTGLLDELEPVAETLKIKTKNNRLWPSTPNVLSRRLNEIKTNLREIGIIIDRPVDTATNTRKIEIRKISPECPLSPEDPNQAQLQLENSGDIVGEIDSISPEYPRQN